MTNSLEHQKAIDIVKRFNDSVDDKRALEIYEHVKSMFDLVIEDLPDNLLEADRDDIRSTGLRVFKYSTDWRTTQELDKCVILYNLFDDWVNSSIDRSKYEIDPRHFNSYSYLTGVRDGIRLIIHDIILTPRGRKHRAKRV